MDIRPNQTKPNKIKSNEIKSQILNIKAYRSFRDILPTMSNAETTALNNQNLTKDLRLVVLRYVFSYNKIILFPRCYLAFL